MRRTLAKTLALLLLPIAAAALPKVAVLDMIAQKDVDQSMVAPVTETIMGEIVASRAYTVLDRAYIDQVFKEKEFQLSGIVSDQQVVQAGQFLGADYVVAGKILLAGGDYFLVAKMIDMQTGAITAQSSEQAEGKALVLLDMARLVGRALASDDSTAEPPPDASPETAAYERAAPANGRIKAGFLISGNGSFAGGPPWRLEAARLDLQDRYAAWLDTVAAYWADSDNFLPSVDRLVNDEGCSIVFSYSPEVRKLRAAAVKYPKILFATNVPLPNERLPNVKNFKNNDTIDFYILGAIAGGLTKTGKLGFLGYDVPAWVVYADYFALGVKATNPKATIYLKAYKDSDSGRAAKDARALVDQGCDVFSPVLDMGQVMDCFKAAAISGKRVLTFGMDLPRDAYPVFLVTGTLTDWSLVLERLLIPLHEGREIPPDTYLVFHDWASRFDGPRQSIDPKWAEILRAKKVRTPDLGEVSVLDFVMSRVDQLHGDRFEPFTGPIKDQRGRVRLGPGEKPDPLFWESLDWLVENVKGSFSYK
jgi:basic membrane protein A and related proteins